MTRTKTAATLKNIQPYGCDERMTADLTHPAMNEEYHMTGEMYICPYTTKSAEVFSQHPKYDSIVAQIRISYTVERSDETGQAVFYYQPLKGAFLKKDTFTSLRDQGGCQMYLAMNDLHSDQMKLRMVLRPAKMLCGQANAEDVMDPAMPHAAAVFAKMFLQSMF
jgi:hypothetical protein